MAKAILNIIFITLGICVLAIWQSCSEPHQVKRKPLWIFQARLPIVYLQSLDETILGVKSADHYFILDKSTGRIIKEVAFSAYGLGGAVLDGNFLYFGGSDFYFRCYDITKDEIVWEYRTQMENEATPLVDSLAVYWGSMDSVVYAVDKISGDLLWQFKTGCHIYAQPLIVDTLLIIGSWDTNLYALHKLTGRLIWKFAAQAGIDQLPIVTDQTIWLPNYDNHIYGLNLQTGQVMHDFIAENAFEFGGAKWKNQLIFSGIDRYFYFVDTGRNQIMTKEKSPVAVSCTPVVQDDRLFTGQYDGSWYRWKLPDMEKELLYCFDDRVLTILSDGKYVWAASWDGALVCLTVK